MASANDLRTAITANRQKLRDALGAASDKWESGDDDGWSPQTIAEHCIGREFGLPGIAAAAPQGTTPAERYARAGDPEVASEFSFPAAADAMASLATSAEACDQVFCSEEDADLAMPAELHAGSLPNTVEGVMVLAAWHLNDHAEPIAKA